MKNFWPVVKFMGVCDNEGFEVAMTVIYLYSLIIGGISGTCPPPLPPTFPFGFEVGVVVRKRCELNMYSMFKK